MTEKRPDSGDNPILPTLPIGEGTAADDTRLVEYWSHDPFDKGLLVDPRIEYSFLKPSTDFGPRSKEADDELEGTYLGYGVLSSFESLESLRGFGMRGMTERAQANYDASVEEFGDDLFRMMERDPEEWFEALPLPEELRERVTAKSRMNVYTGLRVADPDTLLEFARWNRDRISAYKAEHDYHYDNGETTGSPEIARIVADFRLAAERAITEGSIPLTTEELELRLRRIDIVFHDRLALDRSKRFLDAKYSPSKREIGSYIGVDTDHLEHTVFHELTHQLAGQTAFGSYDESLQQDVMSAPNKAGLGSEDRLTWLDEAFTEEVAQQLLAIAYPEAPDGPTYYSKERGAVHDLEELGVSHELFASAYFEANVVLPEARVALYRALAVSLDTTDVVAELEAFNAPGEQQGASLSSGLEMDLIQLLKAEKKKTKR
ncbi:MAG: hypothetical protein WDN27_03980 [Candidatus Saccharibacteria bacterium]